MGVSKEELLSKIEDARNCLNSSIETGARYETIYQCSIELDRLIELYIVSGF
ncbi:MAG: Spo0E family sporulation regulatory protein-aspartic acid phosphatase [Brotaphodocola sp.]